eukprot:8025255-Pyramimonas_sp.AAC.1
MACILSFKSEEADPCDPDWWPLLWKTNIDQYARPISCPALAAFDWPNTRDDIVEPVIGWERWFDQMTRTNVFVPTIQTIDDAAASGAP